LIISKSTRAVFQDSVFKNVETRCQLVYSVIFLQEFHMTAAVINASFNPTLHASITKLVPILEIWR
jgi:uncharacterized membrane protein